MSYFGKAISEKDILSLYAAYDNIYDPDLPCWTTAGQDTQFMVDVDDTHKLITVAFLGTCSIENWMSDLECSTTTLYVYNGVDIRGHSGFFNSYTTAKDDILNTVKAAVEEHPDYMIYALGHSLGGACAQVFAFDYYVQTGTKAHLITYGSPKVWADSKSIEAVRNCMASICQVARSNDMVTTLPPWYEEHLNCSRIGTFKLPHYVNVYKYHLTYQVARCYDSDDIETKLKLLAEENF